MKNYPIILIIFMMASGLLSSCFQAGSDKNSQNEGSATEMSHAALVKKGEYLVTIMGCNDCHSPKRFGPYGPEPDPDKMLSGHPQDMVLPKIDTTQIGPWLMFNPFLTAAVGPWGVSYAANITSDATGIGNWTEEQFFRAIREGKSKGLANNRPLMPPMPWPVYAKLSDEDLRSIFTYLKTVKPVKNVPPPPMTLKEISIQ